MGGGGGSGHNRHMLVERHHLIATCRYEHEEQALQEGTGSTRVIERQSHMYQKCHLQK